VPVALIAVLCLLVALLVYGLRGFDRMVRRSREQQPGGT
jgi:hypothetical protein